MENKMVKINRIKFNEEIKTKTAVRIRKKLHFIPI